MSKARKASWRLARPAAVGDNKWHFVALSFDQSDSGGATLYIDGAVDTTNGYTAAWNWPSGQALQIGLITDEVTYQNYTGLLDDVRYYNSVLSADRISTLFHGVADDNGMVMELDFANPPANGFILNWNESSAQLQSAPRIEGPWLTFQLRPLHNRAVAIAAVFPLSPLRSAIAHQQSVFDVIDHVDGQSEKPVARRY